jgi:hypothetical protein
MKEITMTIPQFLEMERSNFTLTKKEWNIIDDAASYILKDKSLRNIVITSIALTNMHFNVYASELDQLRSAKAEVVGVLQVCIGIICIVMCLLEIGKSLIGNRSSDIGGIIMKYGSAEVGVCIIPKIFTWIAKLCGVGL